MTGSNVDLIAAANSNIRLCKLRRRQGFFLNECGQTYLSFLPRFRRSPVLKGTMLTSTLMFARLCSVCERDLASLGPKTVTRTCVRPCV